MNINYRIIFYSRLSFACSSRLLSIETKLSQFLQTHEIYLWLFMRHSENYCSFNMHSNDSHFIVWATKFFIHRRKCLRDLTRWYHEMQSFVRYRLHEIFACFTHKNINLFARLAVFSLVKHSLWLLNHVNWHNNMKCVDSC